LLVQRHKGISLLSVIAAVALPSATMRGLDATTSSSPHKPSADAEGNPKEETPVEEAAVEVEVVTLRRNSVNAVYHDLSSYEGAAQQGVLPISSSASSSVVSAGKPLDGGTLRQPLTLGVMGDACSAR
jgi:hypothetical protein